MKTIVPLLVLSVALSIPCQADDRLRDVQAELKTQGFFYGEVSGKSSPETSAAIRRYQIRNGLEVTGTMTDETVKALGIGASPSARVPQEPPQPPPAPFAPAPQRTAPPQVPRSDQSLENDDKTFLRYEESKQRTAEPRAVEPRAVEPRAFEPSPSGDESEDDPSVVPAPRPLDVPSADLPVLFADTPYATAPVEVQVSTLRRAQSFLTSRNLYHEAIDGEAGPATEEAIISFQSKARLRLTGRLDLETLSAMHLLPGRAPVPLKGFIPEEQRASGQRVLRGIWIR